MGILRRALSLFTTDSKRTANKRGEETLYSAPDPQRYWSLRRSQCGQAPIGSRSRSARPPTAVACMGLKARQAACHGSTPHWGPRRGSVMVSQLRDMDCIFVKFIDKSVFIGNSPGPVAGKGMLQWFRLTNTFKGISFGLINKSIETSENFFIGFLPIEIVLPGVVGEDELHSTSSFSVPFPFSSWAMDSIKRLVFFGDRKR